MKADNYFAIVPEWVLYHAELSDAAVRLYAILRRYADRKDEAWPSKATLAARLDKSQRQVRRILIELESAGAIKVQHIFAQSGGQRSNTYTVITEPPGGGMSSVTPRGEADDPGADDPGDTQTIASENQSQSIEADDPDDRIVASLVGAIYEIADDPLSRVGTMTASEVARLRAAAAELAEAGASPDEVTERVLIYRNQHPTMPVTARAIAANWSDLRPSKNKHHHEWHLSSAADSAGTHAPGHGAETYVYRCECGAESEPITIGEGTMIS